MPHLRLVVHFFVLAILGIGFNSITYIEANTSSKSFLFHSYHHSNPYSQSDHTLLLTKLKFIIQKIERLENQLLVQEEELLLDINTNELILDHHIDVPQLTESEMKKKAIYENSTSTTTTDDIVDDADDDEFIAHPHKQFASISSANMRFENVCTPQIEIIANDKKVHDYFYGIIPNPDQTLKSAALHVCQILYRTPSDVPSVIKVQLNIVSMKGVAYTSWTGGSTIPIHLSSEYMFRQNTQEITGVIQHEMTHVYQQYKGQKIYWTEGLADFVRFKAIGPLASSKGGSWKDGYRKTALFLLWLDQRYPDFIYKFNQALRQNQDADDDQLFMRLTGTRSGVQTLWNAYQASRS